MKRFLAALLILTHFTVYASGFFGFGGGGGGAYIGGGVTGGTAGSILFISPSAILAQDNANFFWDATNFRLGLRTAANPVATLDILQNTSDYSRFYNTQTAYTLLSSGTSTVAQNVFLKTITSNTTVPEAAGSITSVNINPSGNLNDDNRYGGIIDVNIPAANSANTLNIEGQRVSFRNQGSGNPTDLTGLMVSATNAGSGTLGNYFSGLKSSVTNSGSGASNLIGVNTILTNSSANATSAFGVFVDSITNAGTLANTYGVYIGDITSGTQTNTPYGVYSSDTNAQNFLGGNLGVGTVTAPGQSIDASGTARLRGLSTAGPVITSATGVLSSEALLALSRGGTNKNMTPSNGGIVWTDTDSQEVLSAGSSGQILTSGGTATPAWVTTLPAANGGTGAGAFTTGSVVFAGGSGVYTQDNTNFFWDDTNNRLGIGTSVPTSVMHIRQTADSSVTATPVGLSVDSVGAAGELTAAAGTQTFVNISPVVNQGAGAGYTAFKINSTETAIGSGAKLLIDAQLANTSVFNVTSGGSVGVGVTPTSKLHVQQTADTAVTATPIMFSVDSVGAAGELTASSGTQTFSKISPVVNQSSTAAYTALTVNSTETATGSGAHLLADFQLAGSSVASITSGGAITSSTSVSALGITMGSNNGLCFAGSCSFAQIAGTAGSLMTFGTGGTERMRITSGGSVGIGVTPTSKFHVQQTADSTQTATPVAFSVDSVGAAGELTASSGSQTFASFSPVVNQSGTASYNGLSLNVTETAIGSGSQTLFNLLRGGVAQFSVGRAGVVTTAGNYTVNDPSYSSIYAGNGITFSNASTNNAINTSGSGSYLSFGTASVANRMTLDAAGQLGIGPTTVTSLLHVQQGADSTQTATPVALNIGSVGAAGELTASSGTQTFAQIAPIVNQSSTAAYTALKVNATQTATGSGAKLLADFQTGGTSVTSIDSSGNHTLNAQAELRLADADSSNYIALKSAATVGSNYTVTLPAAAPGTNTFLKYDGSNYTWTAVSGASVTDNYFSGYMSSASQWSTTSTTLTDPTNSGGNALTTRFSNGLTVTAAGSNLPGITFTPANATDVFQITARATVFPAPGEDAGLTLTDGTNVVTSASVQGASVVNTTVPMTLTGIYASGATSAVTVKLQLATTAGTATIRDLSSISGINVIEWTIVRIK